MTESGIVRSDIRSSFGTGSATAPGVPFVFAFTILDLANGGAPFADAAVYAWHCNRDGAYSLYGTGIENENYLRGVQLTDQTGTVSFTSIFPACYSGRWPHVHFEVYPNRASISDAGNAIATSQMALPQHICEQVYATDGYQQSVGNLAGLSLGSDNVFGDDGGAHQLATVTGNLTAGFRASLVAGVDTGTTPTGGGAPAGAPGQGAPGG
nr:intradiol ring-cleavage dioxygenase [Nakamurella aerolata]